MIKSHELLDLLFRCLEAWTTDSGGAHLGHGVPQGPEPSAFLAECFLFHFDAKPFKGAKYLRYVDDIKLMAKDEAPLRRALLKLDLASKELGLVPQAQKIEIRKVASLQEIQKTIPSAVASAAAMNPTSAQSQKELLAMFRRSLRRTGRQWIIDDITEFKFSLLRLNPRRDVLKRIETLLVKRPDCSWVFGAYLKKFPNDPDAANILLEALRQDPTYDAAAANYIEAMDVCEPSTQNGLYRQVIQTVNRRSEEKSILLEIASLTFHGRRLGPKDAAKLIGKQKHPLVKSILLHRLFGNDPSVPYKLADCMALLEREVNGGDADLARFCASLLLPSWPWFMPGVWRPTRAAHHSVKLLMLGLGLRARAPRKLGVLDAFFNEKMKISTQISWRKALGSDWRDVERRCLRLQQLQVNDPGAMVLMLDTFNELLLQAFSRRHLSLASAYSAAAGKNPHPDFGDWVNRPLLAAVLPRAINWFRNAHKTRVGADLAHAKFRSGSKRGTSTKPVTFNKADMFDEKSPMRPGQNSSLNGRKSYKGPENSVRYIVLSGSTQVFALARG